MSQAQQGASLNPNTFTGGVLDDTDADVVSMRFKVWDYDGEAKEAVLGIIAQYQPDDDNKPRDQFYSLGAATTKRFIPSEDGKRALPTGTSAVFTPKSNGAMLLSSILGNGFPENRLADDISVFDGMNVHLSQVTPPKRGDGDPKPFPIVTKINRLPWDPKPAGTGKRSKNQPPVPVQMPVQMPVQTPIQYQQPPVAAAPVPVPVVQQQPQQPQQPVAAAPSGDVASKAIAATLAILAAKGGRIAKVQLPQEVFGVLMQDPDRNAVVSLVYQDAFHQSGVPWQFDGTTIFQ